MGGAAALCARIVGVTATMTERSFNLVVPLAHEATDMRSTETPGSAPGRSGAVSCLNTRASDVDSTTGPLTRGFRTSTTATRTTTTRTTSSAPAPSADRYAASDLLFSKTAQGYFDCRRTKRNSASALAFEANLEFNLRQLHDELVSGAYKPGRSICFVITRPKPREVWAAEFRDRIVHHVLHNRISGLFYPRFIADSCACIPGRGTLYAGRRLEAKIRSQTQNWSRPSHYLKCDLANFFVSINKHILRELLARHIHDPWWLALTETVLFHDPRQDFITRGSPYLFELVPKHKRLALQPDHLGLPIGNLSSQFFANVYLNELDQFVKHELRCKHYIRYVDDFVLLHESPQWLYEAHKRIEAFLPSVLGARLNPTKTILQPIDRGVDFVGHVIKPWSRTTRRRTVNCAIERIRQTLEEDLLSVGNSYLGFIGQASHPHKHRALIANELLARGHCIKSDLTKIYRKATT